MTMTKKIVLTLQVPSIEDTVAWYENVLGWSGHYDIWNERGECLFGSVVYGAEPDQSLNLGRLSEDLEQPSGQCLHCTLWIYVDDVDAVYDRAVAGGLCPEEPPEDRFWGERTFSLRDLNGVELLLAQSIEQIEVSEIRERHQALLAGKEEDAD